MKDLSVPIWRLLTLRSGDFRAGEKSGYQDNGQTESHFHLKLPSLYLESELLTWFTSPFFHHAFGRVAYIRGFSGWRGTTDSSAGTVACPRPRYIKLDGFCVAVTHCV